MNIFIPFLKLIRIPNLLYIILTQLLLYYCIIEPVYSITGHTLSLSSYEFALLVFSTVCIAAAGYIINDYFDVQADEINKPERIFINRNISRRAAILWHLFFNALGIALGFYLAVRVGVPRLGFIHVGAASLLWYYSNYFKRKFLIGNILVALLTALVVLMVAAYEPTLFKKEILEVPLKDNVILQYFLGYAFFAFMTTLLREVVKDMEDMQGDEAIGCRTLPLVLGLRPAKMIAAVLAIFIVAALFMYQRVEWGYQLQRSVVLVFSFLQLPLLYVVYLLWYADKSSDFKYISLIIKLIMLFGILYLIYFRSTIQLNEPVLQLPILEMGE